MPCSAKRPATTSRLAVASLGLVSAASQLFSTSNKPSIMMCVLLIYVITSFSANASETLSSRSVNTKYGALRGIVMHFKSSSPPSSDESSSKTSSSSGPTNKGTNLRPVEVFLGVPYATPPIGSLRFMPPVTPTHWRGVKLANRFGPVCPQRIPDAALRPPSPASSYRNSSLDDRKQKLYVPPSSPSSSSSTHSSDQLPEGRLSYLLRYIPFLRNQSEDCLYLNIYVPFGTSKWKIMHQFHIIHIIIVSIGMGKRYTD